MLNPEPGYSVNKRHWEQSRKYERFVEALSGKPYESFVRDYYKNEQVLLHHEDSSDNDREVIISSNYKHNVFKYIINKAHALLYGLSSSAKLDEDDWYRILEEADDIDQTRDSPD